MRRLIAAFALAGTLAANSAWAQSDAPALPRGAPPDCSANGNFIHPYPLPNIARALRERRRIVILTMGASSGGPRRDYYGLIETYLKKAFSGLEVVIVDRGVSGELARNAAERIRLEVALNSADLVLWQVGTFDAMARVPLEEFERSVAETASWLKAKNVDLVLVGLHYLRGLRRNLTYQAFRDSVRKIAEREKVIRIGRYEAGEMIETAKAASQPVPDEVQLSEEGYACMAEVVARALATSLFARKLPGQP